MKQKKRGPKPMPEDQRLQTVKVGIKKITIKQNGGEEELQAFIRDAALKRAKKLTKNKK